MQILSRDEWSPLERAHRERAEELTRAHLQRRLRGEKHPIWDFLFEYYGFKPGQLARWHPGADVGLRDAAEVAERRYYRTDGSITALDCGAFVAARGDGLRFALRVLRATQARPARFDCFGLHEWAMVYRLSPEQVRHQSLPLRLGADGVNAVVDAHELRCSHFDAFRFFTPAAAPRNALTPTREDVAANEQPGCLHGGAMDLYRWAFKFAPAVPGELLLDCFELARNARLLDMQSSPYDLSALGYANIPVETAAGKAEHVHRQRELSERAAPLRERLIAALAAVESGGSAPGTDVRERLLDSAEAS